MGRILALFLGFLLLASRVRSSLYLLGAGLAVNLVGTFV